jgi:hypothetical protein
MSLVAVGAAVMVSTAGVAASGAATRGSTGAAVAVPVVKVSPSTGLVDLQKVTVTGSGFRANAQIATVECRLGATGAAGCDLGTLIYDQTDKHGAFTVIRYVRRLIFVNGKTIDCGAAAGCQLGAGDVSTQKGASQTIFFNPKIPPKIATITVSPSTLLVDHQLVTVSGKSFAPSTSVNLYECVTHPPTGAGQVCDFSTQRSVTADIHGTFTATNVVLERRQVFFTRTGNRTVDCAAKADTCDIQASPSGLGSSPAEAPLAFNRFVPPAVPSVQLSPSSPLQDLEAVTLTGTGLTPGDPANVQECVAATKNAACDYTTIRTVNPDFHGNFTLTYYVRRDITASAVTGTTTTDCATTACELIVQGSPSLPTTTVALTFDPNVPPITPTITAEPNTGLTDNQTTTVALNGFTPDQPVQIIECSDDALTETNGFSYCDNTTTETINPTGPQTVDTPFVVHATVGGQAGLQDCTTQPGACVLVATETNGYYGIVVGTSQPDVASTPLTFTTP